MAAGWLPPFVTVAARHYHIESRETGCAISINMLSFALSANPDSLVPSAIGPWGFWARRHGHGALVASGPRDRRELGSGEF